MNFEFRRHRIDKISKEQAMQVLLRAVEQFGAREFGKREFNEAKLGLSASTIRNIYGSWSNAMAALRKILSDQGVQLATRRKIQISDELLFAELRKVWLEIGHRPSRIEWEAASPKYSYGTYRIRFGGWQNACLKFIEYSMGATITILSDVDNYKSTSRVNTETEVKHQFHSRNISPKLRLAVLDRDGYRCCLCGRSPAIERGVVLHLDHIVPFSKGGLTNFDNLRTLCSECNLGKSASAIAQKVPDTA